MRTRSSVKFTIEDFVNSEKSNSFDWRRIIKVLLYRMGTDDVHLFVYNKYFGYHGDFFDLMVLVYLSGLQSRGEAMTVLVKTVPVFTGTVTAVVQNVRIRPILLCDLLCEAVANLTGL